MHGILWHESGHPVAEGWLLILVVLAFAALLTWFLHRYWVIRYKKEDSDGE